LQWFPFSSAEQLGQKRETSGAVILAVFEFLGRWRRSFIRVVLRSHFGLHFTAKVMILTVCGLTII
jgi:hypothetical protein